MRWGVRIPLWASEIWGQKQQGFLLCIDCGQRRWSVKAPVLCTYHHETWAATACWGVSCLWRHKEEWKNENDSLLASQAWTAQIKPVIKFENPWLRTFSFFLKTNTQKTEDDSQSSHQFVHPDLCIFVCNMDVWKDRFTVISHAYYHHHQCLFCLEIRVKNSWGQYENFVLLGGWPKTHFEW